MNEFKVNSKKQKQPPEVLCKKRLFLKISQNLQENTCVGVQTLTQVFSCEIYEIFKNSYFEEDLRTAASKKQNYS